VDSIQKEFGSVRFEQIRFGSNIIVIYYVYNSGVVNLQQLLYSVTAMLNELCISDFDTVVTTTTGSK